MRLCSRLTRPEIAELLSETSLQAPRQRRRLGDSVRGKLARVDRARPQAQRLLILSSGQRRLCLHRQLLRRLKLRMHELFGGVAAHAGAPLEPDVAAPDQDRRHKHRCGESDGQVANPMCLLGADARRPGRQLGLARATLH